MKKFFILLLPLLLTACFPNNSDTPADKRAKTIISGTMVGAVVGGAVVNGFAQVPGAAERLAGMAVGGTVGYLMAEELSSKSLSPEDQRMRRSSLFMALNDKPLHNPADWKSAKNPVNGTIVPTNQYVNNLGQVCRTYTEIITNEQGRSESEQVACKYPGGTWAIE